MCVRLMHCFDGEEGRKDNALFTCIEFYSTDTESVSSQKNTPIQFRFLNKRRTDFYRSIGVSAPLQTIYLPLLELCIALRCITSHRRALLCVIPSLLEYVMSGQSRAELYASTFPLLQRLPRDHEPHGGESPRKPSPFTPPTPLL